MEYETTYHKLQRRLRWQKAWAYSAFLALLICAGVIWTKVMVALILAFRHVS